MCVKIIKNKKEVAYDSSRPLEEQIGDGKVVVDYQPEDPAIGKFVDEVERICQNGIACNLNIVVKTNNILKGARVKRKAEALEFQLKLNDLIKLMAIGQAKADSKLEELANYCMDGTRVKS